MPTTPKPKRKKVVLTQQEAQDQHAKVLEALEIAEKLIGECERGAFVDFPEFMAFVTAATDSGHGDVGPGRSSYGTDVKGEISSVNDDLERYRQLTLNVRLYDDPALQVRRPIRVFLDDDPLARNFQLIPVAGEIKRAVDAEQLYVHGLLSETGHPVFRGSPWYAIPPTHSNPGRETMLVLSRKPGESLVFIDNRTGERILIRVAAVTGKRTVRLATTATDHWRIVREELIREEATPCNQS
jgi:sRNA-binding carbon storage regulator CsrA